MVRIANLLAVPKDPYQVKDLKIDSPTYNSMKNSSLIKFAGRSFDMYYNFMKKKK